MERLVKFKSWLKDIFYFICFLFRPIITVGVSFVFMLISLGILIIVIQYISEDTRTYEILLAILTGLTASFFVSITIELCNNYRFNYKRHRELRKYFGFVGGYKLHQKSHMKSRNDNEITYRLGNGYVYDVFIRLREIIPQLRESLSHSDYLYQKEVTEIDDIIYNYDDLIQLIEIKLLSIYLILVKSKTEESNDSRHKEKSSFIENYPELYKFLEEELKIYTHNPNNESHDLFEKSSKYLKAIIEKGIFYNPEIFSGYFEITDKRYIKTKEEDPENFKIDESLNCEESRFNFLSDRISHKCGEIDKSMTKLQKRVTKEPHFWVMAEEGLDI